MPWGRVAQAQAGVITRAQLLAEGVSASQVGRLVRSGGLAKVGTGLYLVRGAPPSYEAAQWRAVLATRGVLGFASACYLWEMLAEPPNDIHVIVGTDTHLGVQRGVRLHRRDVRPSRVAYRAGLPVTARIDSLLDHLTTLPFRDAATLADRALQRRWLRPHDLQRRLDEYGGRSGVGTLRRLAAQLGDGAAAESERVLHRLLRRAGIDGWLPNHRVRANGRTYVLDVAIPHARIAIEIDGFAFHSDAERFQGDRERQNDLVTAGWTVLRFTWADLVDRPEYVIARTRAQLARSA